MNMNKELVKVDMTANGSELICLGFRLGINNAESLSKEVLVKRVNNKIDQRNGVTPERTTRTSSGTRAPRTTNSQPAKKASSVDGEVVTILGKMQGGKMILANRKMKVTSITGDVLIGYLIKDSDGTLQNSQIKMETKFTNYKKAQ